MTPDEIKIQIKAVYDDLAKVEPAKTADDVYRAILLRQNLQAWVLKLGQTYSKPTK